jgi:hypothetical protein
MLSDSLIPRAILLLDTDGSIMNEDFYQLDFAFLRSSVGRAPRTCGPVTAAVSWRGVEGVRVVMIAPPQGVMVSARSSFRAVPKLPS